MRRRALLLALATAGAARAQDLDGLRDLAPRGMLRLAVGVGPVGSAFWTVRDPVTGQPRGVAVDLGRALAQRVGLPLVVRAYPSSGAVTEAAAKDEWDVAFMPEDAERGRFVDFGPEFYLTTSTYLVPGTSRIADFAAVDRPGVRVAGVANTTTIRSAKRALQHAQVLEARSVEEILGWLRDGRAEALALGRESLDALAETLPGSRVLDGHFHATGTAVAVPPGRPLALALVTAFMEDAKRDGTVRRALDAHGITGPVAP